MDGVPSWSWHQIYERGKRYFISWLADTPKLVPWLSWSWHQIYERGKRYFISWLADTPKLVPRLSWSQHQIYERGKRYFISWLADTPKLVPWLSWSWHQIYERGKGTFCQLSLFLSSSIVVTNSSALLCSELSWFQKDKAWCHKMSRHQKLMLISLTSKSILQSSTELAHIGCIYMCIVVLCTSHCVVFFI